MTYTLPYGLQSTTTDEVTFTYTISDFFGGTDIATVTIGVRGTVDSPETLDPTSSPSSYPTEQDKTASPTRSPVSAAPVTSRPTAQPATPSYLIEVVGDNDGRYTGVCEDSGAVCSFAHELCGNQPCGGSIVGPSTYETISGGSVTYQFIPDSCYNEPTYDSSGMLNGHFDAVSFFFPQNMPEHPMAVFFHCHPVLSSTISPCLQSLFLSSLGHSVFSREIGLG